MKDQFWTLMTDIKYHAIYAEQYCIRATHIVWIIQGCSLFASASCVAAWGVWQQYPAVWACIIAAIQVLELFSPLFPYQKRIALISPYSADLHRLCYSMEQTWNNIEYFNGEHYTAALILDYELKHQDIIEKYFGDDFLPQIDAIENRSTKLYEQYFDRFAIRPNTEGGENYANSVNAQANQSNF